MCAGLPRWCDGHLKKISVPMLVAALKINKKQLRNYVFRKIIVVIMWKFLSHLRESKIWVLLFRNFGFREMSKLS